MLPDYWQNPQVIPWGHTEPGKITSEYNTRLEVEMKCPKCNKEMYPPRVALSRRDNKTNICPDCGTQEAIADYMAALERQKEGGSDV